MIRPGGAPYPATRLPEGFALAWFQHGWEANWLDVQTCADPAGGLGPSTHARYFGEAPGELPGRQAFLLDSHGRFVGTATAWFGQRQGRPWGRLHWVAIVPEYQGHGLAQSMLSVVCERVRLLHPDGAFLRTAAHRVAAIAIYLKFGFVPDIDNAQEAACWKAVLDSIRPRSYR
jgi:GNAT superfamily N-acetyltransferase